MARKRFGRAEFSNSRYSDAFDWSVSICQAMPRLTFATTVEKIKLFAVYYLCVPELGEVGPGDTLTLLERPLPDWTVARINDAMYVHKDDITLADTLGRLPLLAEAWRSPFRRRAGLIRYRER
jgi:MOSC domain-containing protein YiiM